MMFEHTRPLLISAALWLTLVGCGGEMALVHNEPPEQPGPPAYGGSIVIGLIGETNNWLPGRGSFLVPAGSVVAALYDSLILRDHELVHRPYLAESISPNADYTQWTLKLRPNVRFHDGTPLDAAALKWNFDHLHKTEGSVTFGAVRDVRSITLVDELTVRYELEKGLVAFPDVLTGPVGMPFSPTAAQRLGEDAGSAPVGTGPFRFVSWRRDDRIVLRRNEDYWQPHLPYLDEIVFRPLIDEDTRLASLLTGDVQAIQTQRPSIVDRLRRTPGIHRYEVIGNNSGVALVNTNRPPLDDLRVRRALAYALHQETLREVVGGAHLSPPQTQFFGQASPWHSGRAASSFPQADLERARTLFLSYRDDPERSDGKAPGEPVEVEYLCRPDPSLIELAQMYQALWRAAGFDVRLRQSDMASGMQRIISGDYLTSCWRLGNEDDPYVTLANAFSSAKDQSLNYTRFTHPTIDENLEVLRLESDFRKRYAAVERISLLLNQEVPLIWGGATIATIAVKPEVRNVAGWRFPDGHRGDGIPLTRVMWGHVWLAPGP